MTTKSIIEYKAKDGQTIKLSLDTVKRYLVQGRKELISDQEFMFFAAICKSSGLNPYARDAYLIKYSNDPAAIIVSIEYKRARALVQPNCQGWKKGIIVMNKDGLIRDSFGLIMPEDELLGGWFEAQPKGWIETYRLEVNLSGYIKKTKEGKITKFWKEENQPTMIAKVAESQGLSALWPNEFKKMYVEEEIRQDDEVIDITPGQRGDDISKALDEVSSRSSEMTQTSGAGPQGGEKDKGTATKKEKPTAAENLKDTMEKIEEKEEADKYLDGIDPEIRKFYINKRKGKGTSGLSGVVMEHAKEIPYWPKGNYDELVRKWAMMYKGNPPFPREIKWLGGPELRPEANDQAVLPEDTKTVEEQDPAKDEPEEVEAEIPELCNRCDKAGCGGAFSQLYRNADGALACETFVMDNNPDPPEAFVECTMYGQKKKVTVCATCKKGTDGKCPEYEEYLKFGAIQFGEGRK